VAVIGNIFLNPNCLLDTSISPFPESFNFLEGPLRVSHYYIQLRDGETEASACLLACLRAVGSVLQSP
jgi:hypothetical protein